VKAMAAHDLDDAVAVARERQGELKKSARVHEEAGYKLNRRARVMTVLNAVLAGVHSTLMTVLTLSFGLLLHGGEENDPSAVKRTAALTSFASALLGGAQLLLRLLEENLAWRARALHHAKQAATHRDHARWLDRVILASDDYDTVGEGVRHVYGAIRAVDASLREESALDTRRPPSDETVPE